MKKLFVLLMLVVCASPIFAVDMQNIEQPYIADHGAVTVDGNLDDWAGSMWVPFDTTYASGGNVLPSDIMCGRYTVRWDDTTNLLYVGVVIIDTQLNLADGFVAWNGQDDIEVYVDAGENNNASPITYSSKQDLAQQIFVGVSESDPNVAWSILAGQTGTTDTDILAAFVANVVGNTLTYELAIVPNSLYGELLSPAQPNVVVDLEQGETVGLDVVAGTKMDDESFSMAGNNIVGSKFKFGANLQTWQLVPEPASLSLLVAGGLLAIRRR